MFTYKLENGIPIKSWIGKDEYYRDVPMVQQCENLSKLPFAFRHVFLAPDGHCGYGMPIGGVLATKGVVICNAVGVDIGCGMCAVKTSLKVDQLDTATLKKIMGEIRKVVPVGFGHHQEPQAIAGMPYREAFNVYPIIDREHQSSLHQLGTLGGGNHFIEIQKDSNDFVWIMIHSGSRNLGKKVADYYNGLAVALNEKWFSSVPTKWELAFLPMDSGEGQAYLREMNYCVDFALANRKLMMDRVLGVVNDVCGGFEVSEEVNIAHNYAKMENHFGQNVMVHRKGATLAQDGTIGIIPGSQGSKSYIVRGKGNPESFMSCSHGAGRRMGRKEACRTLNLEEEIRKMDEKGIIHGMRNQDDLDESTAAYKDIDVVMACQADLVDVVETLTPMAVIKG